MAIDVLVVGSGLTGSVIARQLHDAGLRVLVVERRPHVGGNVHDHLHHSGIRVHTYGPHYFRTNNVRIWRFVHRFARFFPFSAVVKTWVGGSYERWPLAADDLRRVVGDGWEPAFRGEPSDFEEASLAMMPRAVYERYVRGYTEKQWGVAASSLDAALARRFHVREGDDARLVQHRFQGLPEHGYAAFMDAMLDGIPVELACDFRRERHRLPSARLLVYTGPIDSFFAHRFGPLQYRGQQREHDYVADHDWILPCGQVNNPDPANGSHIRSLEWKHMMPKEQAARIRGTLITRETPYTPAHEDGFEYPFPDGTNRARYARYRQEARRVRDVVICGRLGEYRYYDMDQAIGRALVLARRILGSGDAATGTSVRRAPRSPSPRGPT